MGSIYINEYEAFGKRYTVGAPGVYTTLAGGNRMLHTSDGPTMRFDEYNIKRTTGTTVVHTSGQTS